MSNTVLITGISGQIGSYLAEFYLKEKWDVHGFVRQRTDLSFLKGIQDKLELHIQDIRDPHGVWASIKDLQPRVIHHLAAMTYVPYSWVSPTDTIETNVNGTLNILEAVRTHSPHTVVQYAGSSEEYGLQPPIPANEEMMPHPASPYGISKLAADLLCQQYHLSHGLKTVVTRAFNHDSPRRGKQFVTTQIVLQALEILHKKRVRFTLGNLDAIRDYSDARDIVSAYYMAVTSPEIDYGEVYNVCTGKGTAVRKLVDIVAGIANVPSEIEQDPKRLRPSDIPCMLGSAQKFTETTGWKPRYTVEDTLHWMLETLEGELY